MNKAKSWSVKSSFEKAIKTDKFLVSVSKKKKDVTFLKKKRSKKMNVHDQKLQISQITTL